MPQRGRPRRKSSAEPGSNSRENHGKPCRGRRNPSAKHIAAAAPARRSSAARAAIGSPALARSLGNGKSTARDGHGDPSDISEYSETAECPTFVPSSARRPERCLCRGSRCPGPPPAEPSPTAPARSGCFGRPSGGAAFHLSSVLFNKFLCITKKEKEGLASPERATKTDNLEIGRWQG